VVLMVLEGPNAVAVTRATMGKTNPVEASPGTIRGDLGLMTGRNLIHGSDATASAEREIALFFAGRDVPSWERDSDRWVVE
jgi:nucleoside-diphosphate kinase